MLVEVTNLLVDFKYNCVRAVGAGAKASGGDVGQPSYSFMAVLFLAFPQS